MKVDINKLQLSKQGNEFFCNGIPIPETSYKILKLIQPIEIYKLKGLILRDEESFDLREIGRILEKIN